MFIIPQPPRVSGDFRKTPKRVSNRETKENTLHNAANENAFAGFVALDYRPATRNAPLLQADNNAILVEGRPENIYGPDCILCRETYQNADTKSRALIRYGVEHADQRV